MKENKIIITGGAGFIGSHLVDKMVSENFDVTVLDNFSTGRIENLKHIENKIKIVECDISEKNNWDENFKNCSAVFHLAALADIVPSITNPKEYFNSNVTGTFNVLEASRKNNVKKLVYSASSSCYGIPKKYPTPENANLSPEYPYALTKKIGEDLVIHWAKIYNLRATSLRFFNVYGPRSRTSGTYGAVLGVFLAQKLAGKPFTIVGDGTQTRDFTYVTDIVDAIYSVFTSNIKFNIFNVGSGKTTSVNRLANLLMGNKVFIPKRPGEPDCTFADISRIKKSIGWTPKIPIEDGISKVLKEIDYWRNAPVWTPETIKEETKVWFNLLGKESE